MTDSIKPRLTPKCDPWGTMTDALESGVKRGYYRAHKHVDKPTEDHLCDAIVEACKNELGEAMEWEGNPSQLMSDTRAALGSIAADMDHHAGSLCDDRTADKIHTWSAQLEKLAAKLGAPVSDE